MKIEIRSDDSALITGYVNVVGRESKILYDPQGEFVEIVKPQTFARALEKTDEVGLMFNHKRIIGSTKQGLDLFEDNIGLYARAMITDPEVIKQARENKLSGWSFGFYMNKDSWKTREDGMKLRTLEDIDLIEVSILNVEPAYIATSIEMRDDGAKLCEYRAIDNTVEVIDQKIDENKSDDQMVDIDIYKKKIQILSLKG